MDINFQDYLIPLNTFNGRINIMGNVEKKIIKKEGILT
jgi:hypothetical protein